MTDWVDWVELFEERRLTEGETNIAGELVNRRSSIITRLLLHPGLAPSRPMNFPALLLSSANSHVQRSI